MARPASWAEGEYVVETRHVGKIHLPAPHRPGVKPILLRAPMATAAGAMIAGIVLGRYLVLPAGLWAAVAAAALLAAGALLTRPHLHQAAGAATGLAILASSAFYLHLTYFSHDANHVVRFTGDRPILATLRGRVVTMPQVQADAGPHYLQSGRTTFLLQASEVLLRPRAEVEGVAESELVFPTASAPADGTREEWGLASGLVRVAVQEVDPRLQPGMELEVMGWLGRFDGPDNPGQTDWARVAREHGVLARLAVEAADGIEIRRTDRPWAVRTYWQLRSALRDHLWASGGAEQGPLLGALIVGEREPALRELNRMMVRAGTAHFLSISGMHLAIFVAFIYAVCRLASLSPRTAAIVVLSVLGTYVLMAQPNAPLLRAALMAGCVCLGTILRRPYTSLNALAASAALLLAVDPMQLFAAGFQLSFSIVAGLILLHRPLRRLLFGRWLRRRGLIVFRQEEWFRRWLYYRVWDGAITAVTVSLAASLVSMPLVAVHFGLFSPYAPVLSLLLSPLILLVLVPGYLAAALAALAPNLSFSLGQLASQACEWLTAVVRLCDSLPGLSFNVYPVGPVWAGLWLGGVALAVWAWNWRPTRVACVVAFAAFAGATVYTQIPARSPEGLQLHMLDVGAGQCIVLRSPGGRNVILDAGSQAGLQGEEVIAPFLRALRLPWPSAVFISHANVDHFNGLMSPQGWIRPSQLWVNPWLGLGQDEPPEAAEFLRAMNRVGCRTQRVAAGRTLQLDEQTTAEVLWPPAQPQAPLVINDTSLVLRVTAYGRSILLPGDLEAFGQQALIRMGSKIRSEVLVLPHHGGWRRTLPEFVAAVSPRVVLVSAAREPQGSGKPEDPSRSFYHSLKKPGRWYSTPRNGWICIDLAHELPEVTTMTDRREGR